MLVVYSSVIRCAPTRRQLSTETLLDAHTFKKIIRFNIIFSARGNCHMRSAANLAYGRWIHTQAPILFFGFFFAMRRLSRVRTSNEEAFYDGVKLNSTIRHGRSYEFTQSDAQLGLDGSSINFIG